MIELITYSRQDSFKSCRRKHYFAYELAMRPVTDSKALRQGSAYHDGLAAVGRGEGTDTACLAVQSHYAQCPDHFDLFEWLMECETIQRLVCAYAWRWAETKLEVVAVELPFELPLINPATGKRTPTFNLAGKIDGIVRLEDGRLAVKESKLLSDDIGDDAPLWRCLRMDHQISLYIHAARQLGYDVDTVLYDVTRKPAIAPNPVPVLDGDGLKIVLDHDRIRVQTKTKTWRQTGDKELGYELQTRPMTTDEWGAKLTDDVCSRPEFYFARREVPRLDQDVAEFQRELWDLQLQIRQAQREGLWYRTVNRNVCRFCPYFSPCSEGRDVRLNPPEGFEFIRDVHRELERNLTHVHSRTARTTARTDETAAAPVEAVA